MAKIMKVSRSTYSGWENNIDSIPLIKLNDFCNYFNLSMDYVVGISDKKTNLNNHKNIDLHCHQRGDCSRKSTMH